MTEPNRFAAAVPEHVAIIMDGNGRWARKRLLPRVAGHRAGVENLRAIVGACADRGVRVLTVFAFSSENWRRPPTEVRLLLELFLKTLRSEVAELDRNGVCLKVIGDRSRFPARLIQAIEDAEALTAHNDVLTMVIAANYGGRWDIAQATRKVAQSVVAGELEPDAITPENIAPHLCLAEFPEPDLFIRSGGEQRVSNFLLWQLAYTEMYFTDTLWPDFDVAAFDLALESFTTRERRFGMTGEQVGGEPAASNG